MGTKWTESTQRFSGLTIAKKILDSGKYSPSLVTVNNFTCGPRLTVAKCAREARKHIRSPPLGGRKPDFRWLVLFLQAFGALVDFQRSQLVFKCNQNITSLHHAPLSQATILKSAPSPVSSVYIGKCCRTEIFGTEAVIVGISKDALSKFSLATTTVTTHQQRVSSIITADSSDTMAQWSSGEVVTISGVPKDLRIEGRGLCMLSKPIRQACRERPLRPFSLERQTTVNIFPAKSWSTDKASWLSVSKSLTKKSLFLCASSRFRITRCVRSQGICLHTRFPH